MISNDQINSDNLYQRVLALAGTIEACVGVQSLALSGQIDVDTLQCLVRSIKMIEAPDVVSVFGDRSGLARGLGLMVGGIGQATDAKAIDVYRYMNTLISLKKSLFANSVAQQKVIDRLDWIKTLDEPELFASCAELYLEAVSPLKPRVYVQGEQRFLEQEEVSNKIRTMLLAGIRCVVLWEQLGGGRFEMLLRRKAYQSAAGDLLANGATN
jgi:high frequency lysogenization protein